MLALNQALHSTWASLAAWFSVLTLVLSPLLRLLRVLGRAMWPHVRRGAARAARYQASLPLSTVLIEVAVAVGVVLLLLLRRCIVRRRYIPRLQHNLRLARGRLNDMYWSFSTAVERNFRLSARAFPHVVYWAAAVLLVCLAPDYVAKVRDSMWVCVGVTWPALYALYLVLLLRGQSGTPVSMRRTTPSRAMQVVANATFRSPSSAVQDSRRASRRSLSPASTSPMSPAVDGARTGRIKVSPEDVDRVLMYWVLFALTSCCRVAAGYLPFAGMLLAKVAPSTVRTLAFLAVVWMHLPGPGSGSQVTCMLVLTAIAFVICDSSMRTWSDRLVLSIAKCGSHGWSHTLSIELLDSLSTQMLHGMRLPSTRVM